MAKDYSFRFAHGIVKWKKVIFKEKVILLRKNIAPKKIEITIIAVIKNNLLVIILLYNMF